MNDSPAIEPRLAGRPVGVVGLGESGLAMARWLDRLGARVTVVDDRDAPPAAAALAEHCPSARFVAGPLALARFDGVAAAAAPDGVAASGSTAASDVGIAPDRAGGPEVLYWSPGLSPDLGAAAALHREAAAAGIPIRGELDLFADELAVLAATRDYRPAVIAITGSNGKTTVTQLVGHLCAEAGRDAQVAGNISPSLLDALAERLDRDQLPDVWVLELSSFQLAVAAEPFASTAAVVLNLSQNHLDWHPSFADYLAAKRRILERAACHIVNGDDPASDPMIAAADVLARLPAASGQGALTGGATIGEIADAALDANANGDINANGEINANSDAGVDAGADASAVANAGADVAALTKDERLALKVAAREAAKAARDVAREQARAAKEAAQALARIPRIGFGLGPPAAAPGFGIVRDGGLGWLAEAVRDPADEVGRRRSTAPALINRLMPAEALRIRGNHNQANALAALALCRAIDLPTAALVRGLRDFEAAAHRCSLVAIHHDVEYIDDSKGTNVGATVAALEGLGKRCILIAGGLGKGQSFAPLAGPVRRHARAVMLIGRDAPALRAALADAGAELVDCATLDEAVVEAAARARAGEAVLLSPACASQDMFRNYPHRAEVFIAAVRRLTEEAGQPC